MKMSLRVQLPYTSGGPETKTLSHTVLRSSFPEGPAKVLGSKLKLVSAGRRLVLATTRISEDPCWGFPLRLLSKWKWDSGSHYLHCQTGCSNSHIVLPGKSSLAFHTHTWTCLHRGAKQAFRVAYARTDRTCSRRPNLQE